MSTPTALDALSPNNPLVLQCKIQTPNPTTGVPIPATGLTGITALPYTLIDGTLIPGTTITVTEYSGTPGTYEVAISAGDATLICTATSGKVYLQLALTGAVLVWRMIPIAADRILA